MANPAYGKCYPFEAPAAGEDDQRAYGAEWRHLAGAWGDGIVGDFRAVGQLAAFELVNKSTSTRQLALNLGDYRLKGIHFEPTLGIIGLTIPAVATGQTRRDRLVAKLNPALKQITFEIKTGTPVAVGSPVAFPTLQQDTGGVWEQSLYAWEGTNVPASDLVYTDDRMWVAPTVFRYGPNLPPPGEYQYGQTLVLNRGAWHETFVRRSDGTGAAWVSIDRPAWSDINRGTALLVGSQTPQVRFEGGRVFGRGNAVLRAGSWIGPGDKSLGSVPAGFEPLSPKRFTVTLGGPVEAAAQGACRAVVDVDGSISFYLPSGVSATAANYDQMSYDVEGA